MAVCTMQEQPEVCLVDRISVGSHSAFEECGEVRRCTSVSSLPSQVIKGRGPQLEGDIAHLCPLGQLICVAPRPSSKEFPSVPRGAGPG
jgi:hypothetical protein